MGLSQVENGFYSFLPIFWYIIDDFSKFCSPSGLLDFDKSSNEAKIWQTIKNLPNPFPHGTYKTRKTRFGYPSVTLVSKTGLA